MQLNFVIRFMMEINKLNWIELNWIEHMLHINSGPAEPGGWGLKPPHFFADMMVNQQKSVGAGDV